MTQAQIDQLTLDYQGRAGSLMAVDDHVAKMVKILKKTHQLKDTLIVFVSDNGWLQGEHRITGDKFLPYEESLRVPLIVRGPGVPKNQTVSGQVSNIDFAPTLLDFANAKPGRTLDGVSLLPTIRKPKKRPDRALEIEALAPLFAGQIPVNAWDRPYTGVRTDQYTYVVWTETGEEELYDRAADPYQLNNVAADPAYAAIKAELASKLLTAPALQRRRLQRSALRRLAPVIAVAPAGAVRRRHRAGGQAADAEATARRSLLRDPRAQGLAPGRPGRRLEHDRAQRLPAGAMERVRRRRAGRRARRHPGAPQRAALLPDGFGHRPCRESRRRSTACEMRQAATIAIHSASELVQTPYTERTIDRDNTWRWKKGRRVFELLAPDGSEIRDAELLPDPRPRADDRPAAARSATGSSSRRAGATAAASSSASSCSRPTGRRRSSRTTCSTPTSWSRWT